MRNERMKWNVYIVVVGFLCLVVKKVALCLGYLADREAISGM
jgi:hypothetical protein